MNLGYMMQPHATSATHTIAPAKAASQPTPFPGIRICTDAEQAERLALCNPCEKNVNGKCSICPNCGGRPVTDKVQLNIEFCPAKKWPAIKL